MALYLKATLAGLLAAVVAPIFWVLVRVSLGIAANAIELPRQEEGFGEGSAGIGSVSAGFLELDVLLPMLVGFVLAFFFVMRRSRRAKRRQTSSAA